MVSLIFVLGLCSCGLNSAETLQGPWALRPSPFGVTPHVAHKIGFLEVPPKPSKDVPKPSPAVKVPAKTDVKPQHVNSSAAVEDLMHPKVEYDPDTAALMAQADAAIKEADEANNAPPKPAPKKSEKDAKDEQQNLGMINALRGMVCGHKLKKHLSLCDLKEFQGAEVKSEVHQAVIPGPAEDAASTSDTDSVASRADDLMAKVDSLQNAVAASLPEDAKSSLLDVIHDAKKVSKKHTTGAEAMALMKTDVTANLPASVRDTILSVMKDAKESTPAPSTLMNSDVTVGLPASVRDTVLAVMKDTKH